MSWQSELSDLKAKVVRLNVIIAVAETSTPGTDDGTWTMRLLTNQAAQIESQADAVESAFSDAA